MSPITDDVATILRGFGSAEVRWGRYTVRGRVQTDDSLVPDRSGGYVQSRDRVILIPPGSLPGVKAHEDITVDGVPEKVRFYRLLGPGRMAELGVVTV